jgi:hypothetical protein
LSGKALCFAVGAFGRFGGVDRFGKKIENGVAVFTIEFVDGHGNSLEPISKMHLTTNSCVVNLLKMLTYDVYAGNNDFCVGSRLDAYLNLFRLDM